MRRRIFCPVAENWASEFVSTIGSHNRSVSKVLGRSVAIGQ